MSTKDSEWEMLCNDFSSLTEIELCDKVAESLFHGDINTLANAKIALMDRMDLMSEEELDGVEKYAEGMIASGFLEYQSITCVIPPKRMSKKRGESKEVYGG